MVQSFPSPNAARIVQDIASRDVQCRLQVRCQDPCGHRRSGAFPLPRLGRAREEEGEAFSNAIKVVLGRRGHCTWTRTDELRVRPGEDDIHGWGVPLALLTWHSDTQTLRLLEVMSPCTLAGALDSW